MKILGSASAPMYRVSRNCPVTVGASWWDMFEAGWQAAHAHNIDPVGFIAQMGHETGWGTFQGNVPATFFNPAGLKVRDPKFLGSTKLADGATDLADTSLAHAQFASWQTGCRAQAQHLLAYCGRPINSMEELVAPRRVWIKEPFVTTWEELGGRWAPSLEYGNRIVTVAQRLLA